MELKHQEELWDRNANIDSMRSIIARDDKPQDWHWEHQAFFDSGIDEIQDILNYLDTLAINIPRYIALDFGCGIGRLSQALAVYFDEVHGVDISSSMIEQANLVNQYDNCRYFHNDKPDLSIFSDNTYNLIYSNLVLQHIKPTISLEYIREFIRVLHPNGILMFQLPCGRNDNLRTAIKNMIKSVIPSHFYRYYNTKMKRTKLYYEMHFIARDEVINQITESNGTVHDIVESDVAPGYISLRYSVIK